LFRHTFAVPAHAAGLLCALLPAVIVAAIDWPTLHPCPTAMAGSDLRRRAADLLHAARFCGIDAAVGFLLEHKSSPEADTGEQLLDYVHHLRCEWPGSPSPFLIAVVVYHGERPWPHGTELLLPAAAGTLRPDVAAAVAPLQLQLRFLLDDLTRCSEADLLARAMTPQGILTLLCLRFLRGWTPEEAEAGLRRWSGLMREVAEAPGGRDGLRAVESYAIHVTEVAAERLAVLFAQVGGVEDEEFIMSTAEKLIAKGEARGEARGKALGEAAGRVAVLLRMLTARFGPVPDSIVARLRAASVAELDRCADRLLAAATIDDVFAGG
jgi:head-tail adaptor